MNEINWQEAAYKIATRFRLWTPPGIEFTDVVTELEKDLHKFFGPLLTEHEAAPESLEKLASEFHDIYQQEAKRQGDVRHKDSYADLPENIKEFDRVLARYVLKLIGEAQRRTRLETFRKCGLLILSRQEDWTWNHILSQLDKWIAEENAKVEPHG